MITDVFAKRYPAEMIWGNRDGFPKPVALLLSQLAHVVIYDVLPKTRNAETLCEFAHNQLARELGGFILEQGASFQERCGRFLVGSYNLWNNSHGTPDLFFKSRISLVELIFREADRRNAELAATAAGKSASRLAKALAIDIDDRVGREAIKQAVVEMNQRFREAGVPLHYHSGVIQQVDDSLVTTIVAEPFWAIVADPLWKNVDIDMKEAIDRRDAGGRDASLYALKALESAIKIISDKRLLTKGSEKGASHYIDNLVSTKNGKLIEVWEAEALKALFSSVRNPHGHGPGSEEMPSLSLPQQNWAIESAMSWIKSLIARS